MKKAMFERLSNLLEMIRFSHTLFALPFALLAAVMAWTAPSGTLEVEFRWRDLAGILVCMAAARSVAMTVNRIVDRKLDAKNPRTAGRHLPSGVLTVRTATVFAALCSVVFVASTLLFLPNRLPLYLSLPVLALLAGYSFTKRFTVLAHFWLGASLMLAPVAAWIAIRGDVVLADPSDLLGVAILGGAVLAWVAGFDVIYACQDADFDAEARLFSIPARFGVTAALRIAALCHLGMIGLLVALPLAEPNLGLGWIYGCGVAAVAALLAYEHSIVRANDLARVNVAFFQVNVVVSMGLFVVGTLDLLI